RPGGLPSRRKGWCAPAEQPEDEVSWDEALDGWCHTPVLRRAPNDPSLRWLAARSALGDAGSEQLAHQRHGQRPGRVEVERALRSFVLPEIAGERPQRRPAEREVGASLRGGGKSGDDPSVDAKRRDPVADALLGFRDDPPDRPPQLVERCALLSLHAGQ